MLESLGFARAQRRPPGLLLPTWSPVTCEIAGWQLRPDDPRVDQKRGRVVKYETASERPVVVDVHPAAWEQLGDPSVPLFVTEGIRKADAAISAGLCCIALLGVWNWRGSNDKGGKTALPEWEAVALNDGRRVYIVFDSDVATKPEVRQALDRLKGFLEAKGAEVFVIYLPAGDRGEKVGLDDFLVAEHSVDELLALASPELRTPDGTESSGLGAEGAGATLMPSPAAPYDVAEKLTDDSYRDADGTLLFRSWRGDFYDWNRTSWVKAEAAAVRKELYRGLKPAVYWTDKGELTPWNPNRRKVADVIEALAAVTHTPQDAETPSWLERSTNDPPAHELVAVGNGLLHVPSRQLYDHSPRLLNTVGVPFDYDERAAAPVLWLNFLEELWSDDAEAIAALQEWFGYVISGDTRMHKILFLLGPMRSGKGTIARVIRELIGRANHCGPTLASLGTNFGLQSLIGKSLAIVADARLVAANANVVVERLLSISGEDALTIDRKYREHWSGKLDVRFMILSNELPSLGDSSGAIATRFIVLRLIHSFLGHEDHDLTEKLLAELPGILNWSLDGLDRLRAQDRFTEPGSSREAIVALHDAVSPISAFVRDRCMRGPDYEVPVDRLYEEWRDWCLEQGRDHPGPKSTFAKNLYTVVPEVLRCRPRVQGEREYRYIGIALRASDQQWSGPGTIPDQADAVPGVVRDAKLKRSRSGLVVLDGPGESPVFRAPVQEDPPTVPDPHDRDATGTGFRDEQTEEGLELEQPAPSPRRRAMI
jgi:putative DNA primase/helicase